MEIPNAAVPVSAETRENHELARIMVFAVGQSKLLNRGIAGMSLIGLDLQIAGLFPTFENPAGDESCGFRDR